MGAIWRSSEYGPTDERQLLPAEMWSKGEDYVWYCVGGVPKPTGVKKGVLGDGTLAMRYIRGAADDKPFTICQYEGNALFFGRGKTSALTIPWCTYTEPEIAHVGLYPEQAAERDLELDTFEIEMSQVDRAILEGETEGFLKVHVVKGRDKIVGATPVT